MTSRAYARAVFTAAFTLIAAGVITIAALAVRPAGASAATASWRQQTCQAAAAWQRHPSPATLATLVTDSTHLGRSYLKADAGQLYADASSPSPKAGKYAAKDETYLAEDCAS